MRIAGVCALLLGPLHERRGPRRPALGFRAVGAGIILILQIQQAHVAERLRAEAADFDVVFQNGERLTELGRAGLEELAVEIKTWTPGQIAADIKTFALDVQEHVFGEYTLGWIRVVGTAGGVDVVVAVVETVVHWVDPALQLDLD